MTEPKLVVQCPTCRAAIDVEPEWRLVMCPRCGGMVMRMTDDSSYD